MSDLLSSSFLAKSWPPVIGESSLRAFADLLPALIAHVDVQERYTFVNRAYADWMGCEPGEMEGRRHSELTPKGVYERQKPFILAALAGKGSRAEIELPDRSGERHDLEIHHIPIAAPDGGIIGLCLFSTIGKSQALRESEERLCLALDAAELGTWRSEDAEGTGSGTAAASRCLACGPMLL